MISNLAPKNAVIAATLTLACWATPGCAPDFGMLSGGPARGGAAGLGATAMAASAGGGARGGVTGGNFGGTGEVDEEPTIGGSPAATAGSAAHVGGAPAATGGAPQAIGGMGAGHSGAIGGGASGRGGTSGVAGAGAGTSGLSGASGLAGAGGAPPWPMCQGAGNALFCGPNVYVELARPIQDDFTIEAWIATGAARVGRFFWEGNPIVWADATGDLADFGMSVLNGKLVMNIGMPETSATSTSTVATGLWVHVAATRERASGVIKLYVDGELEATAIGNTASLLAQPVLSVGASAIKASFLDGQMDELKLWEVVRTQAEIQAGMHDPPKQDEPGLVGYYRFDDIVAPVVRDSSLRRNHATISSGSASRVSNAPLCEAATGAGGSGGSAAGSGGSAADLGGSGGASGSGSGAAGHDAGSSGSTEPSGG